MLKEEGGGSVEEGRKITCVEIEGLMCHISHNVHNSLTNLSLLVHV